MAKGHHGAYPAELRARLVELVRSGRSPDDLARQYEPTAQAIRNWVAQAPNGLRGIAASDCVVRGNTVANHATAGIQVTECVVSQNVATLNGGVGISVGGSSSVVENEASGNRGHGIIASGDSSLFDNTVINNAAFLGPAFDGITCFGDCNVRGNTANMNSGRGLVLGTQSVYRENLLVGNAVGGVSGGVNTGDNHCAGAGVVAASCP